MKTQSPLITNNSLFLWGNKGLNQKVIFGVIFSMIEQGKKQSKRQAALTMPHCSTDLAQQLGESVQD